MRISVRIFLHEILGVYVCNIVYKFYEILLIFTTQNCRQLFNYFISRDERLTVI